MKKLLLISISILLLVPIKAQQKDYLRVPVEKAIIDGEDYSEYYKSVGGFISFYQSKIGYFCMANVMPAKDTQSYGEISERNQKSGIDVLTGDTIYILDFRWDYENNYDDKSGSAKCHMVLSPSKTGYVYSLEMIIDEGMVFRYSGRNIESISTLLENW